MNIINPATGEIIKTLSADSPTAIEQKYQKLKAGQKAWAARPLAERVAIIAKFSELLEAEKAALAAILSSEVGKPLGQAAGEINGARGRIGFFVKNAEKWLASETIHEEPNLKEMISFEPLGVIANISAWNYPYLVGVNVFIPALIAGNAVLYKPSEYASLTGLEIARLLYAAGVPEDVFALVLGAATAGQALLELPLDGYYFTGSYATGRYIAEQVAKKLVPCQLELGGKDPLYVSAHNDNIANVAVNAAEGAFYNNGQSCCAVERIYVHASVYDEFISAFVAETKSYKVGSPTEEGVFIGPLTRAAQVAILENQVQDALDKGAKLELGGKAIEGAGYYFEPTVLSNVNHSMLLMTEESFGPIIGIQKVGEVNEAIALMRDTEYGLTSAIYSNNQEETKTFLAQMNSGTVYSNCCDRVSANLPWTGRGNSGLGSTLSYMGIRAFVQPKAWHIRNV